MGDSNTKTKRKRILILSSAIVGLILVFGIIGSVACQFVNVNLTIAGIVRDVNTGMPIPNAIVSDLNYGKKSQQARGQTDSTGAYLYRTWHEEHKIICSAPGYIPQQKLVATNILGGNSNIQLDFQLTRE
jgi:hypothetical protein